MSTANLTFEIQDWQEAPLSELPDTPKLTRANVKRSFSGDLEGEGTLEYLMAYRPDGTAEFLGMERVVGKLEGREGSFVLQHRGAYEAGVAKAELLVVPGTATGELEGLSGKGDFAAGHEKKHHMRLDYRID
jgi:hypothetical protein